MNLEQKRREIFNGDFYMINDYMKIYSFDVRYGKPQKSFSSTFINRKAIISMKKLILPLFILTLTLIFTACNPDLGEDEIGDVASMSAGYHHAAAIKSDGTLWTWGMNDSGRLGIGTTTSKNTPQKVELPLSATGTKWEFVSAGGSHTMALTDADELYAWGNNFDGQLGIGSTTSKNTPQKVELPLGATGTKWVSVSAGGSHTMAITDAGALYSWGNGLDGQLGLGNPKENKSTPQKVGLPSGATGTKWVFVSAGSDYTMAITDAGELYSWGYNSYYKLGINDNLNGQIQIPQLVKINGVGTKDWKSVFAGMNHTIATKTDGSIWAWGSYTTGKLGLGPLTGDIKTPAQIGTDKDWASVSGSQYHTIARKKNDTIWAWGKNDYGQLGDGTTTDCDRPKQIGTATDLKAVSAGIDYTTALREDGILLTWGLNSQGQLGTGTKTDRNKPGPVKWGD
ncbi:MAG: hypothetical protein FWF73_03990 [Spirochaetes bacterium]|nr:hypothetical protein [Spirochaetota bacterium]